jgi:hypothetical protein
MPVLENPKWEKFAKEVARGKTQRVAYKSCGGNAKDADSAASDLAHNPKIKQRIKELTVRVTDKAIERAAITKEWVLRELLDNAEHAKADGSWAARNRSLELVGKEIGMFGNQEPPKPPRLEDLSTEDLMRLLAQPAIDADPTDPPPPEVTQ